MHCVSKRLFQVVIICSCVVFASCRKTDRVLFSYIESVCPQGGEINLKKALGVDYDTAYLFSDCTNGKEMASAMGISYRPKAFLQDSEYKLILLKNHKVVYDNKFYCNKVEFFCYDTMYFHAMNGVWYYIWTDSIFVATPRKGDISGNLFYQLRPVNDVEKNTTDYVVANALLNPDYYGELLLYEYPGGKVTGTIKNDSVREDYILLGLIEKNDSMFYVEAYSSLSDEVTRRGWLKKSPHLGIFSSKYQGDLVLYELADNKSKVVVVEREYNSGVYEVVDFCDGWLKIKAEVDGAFFEGWIPPEEQCCNPYTTCC